MSRETRTKKKTTIILAALAAVLVIAATVGVVAFLKDRGSAQAAITDGSQALPEAGPTTVSYDTPQEPTDQGTTDPTNNPEGDQEATVPGEPGEGGAEGDDVVTPSSTTDTPTAPETTTPATGDAVVPASTTPGTDATTDGTSPDNIQEAEVTETETANENQKSIE